MRSETENSELKQKTYFRDAHQLEMGPFPFQYALTVPNLYHYMHM